MVGIYGLGSEVCKNLVLAGIKSLCVVDHRTVAADCIGAQFLVQGDVGKNVSHALCIRTGAGFLIALTHLPLAAVVWLLSLRGPRSTKTGGHLGTSKYMHSGISCNQEPWLGTEWRLYVRDVCKPPLLGRGDTLCSSAWCTKPRSKQHANTSTESTVACTV